MSGDELKDLAADIKANGLLHPITLDAEGTLLDGRNRREACKMARRRPKYRLYEGDDPHGFIVSCNGKRRHETQSQRAMVAAKAWPLAPKVGGKKGKAGWLSQQYGCATEYIRQSRALLKRAPDLADQVKRGDISLTPAYHQLLGREQKQRARERERKLAEEAEKPEKAEEAEKPVEHGRYQSAASLHAWWREQPPLDLIYPELTVREASDKIRAGLDLDPVPLTPSEVEQAKAEAAGYPPAGSEQTITVAAANGRGGRKTLHQYTEEDIPAGAARALGIEHYAPGTRSKKKPGGVVSAPGDGKQETA